MKLMYTNRLRSRASSCPSKQLFPKLTIVNSLIVLGQTYKGKFYVFKKGGDEEGGCVSV